MKRALLVSTLWVFCVSASMLIWVALSRMFPVYTSAGARVIVPWWRIVVTLSPVVVGGALFFFVFFYALDKGRNE